MSRIVIVNPLKNIQTEKFTTFPLSAPNYEPDTNSMLADPQSCLWFSLSPSEKIVEWDSVPFLSTGRPRLSSPFVFY
jgi:hypothetical protein